MPTLPASTDFTGSGITEAQFKTAMTNMRGFLADLLGTAGTQAAAQVALQALLGAGVDARSGAYTVVAGDRGKLINATGTWTLTLPAAASAGAGFAFAVRNSGSGSITIDPNAAELINGTTAFTLTAGASLVVVCTGTAWVVVGHPGALNYVKQDNGHGEIGSLCFAAAQLSGSATLANPGGTVSGSSLSPSCVRQSTGVVVVPDGFAVTGTLSGTWRCLGYCKNDSTSNNLYVHTMWQRIA